MTTYSHCDNCAAPYKSDDNPRCCPKCRIGNKHTMEELQKLCESREPEHLVTYNQRLADLCEALHMSGNGSSDCLPEECETKIVNYLEMRLDCWTNFGRKEYDGAYRLLIEITLAEHSRTIKRRKGYEATVS
jgi:hypothetical protein